MDKLKALLLLSFGILLCSMSNCNSDDPEVIGTRTISGTVTEQGSNTPIEGIKVVLLAELYNGSFWCCDLDTLSGEAFTDAQGNFTIDYKVYDRSHTYALYVNADPFAIDSSKQSPFKDDIYLYSNRSYTYKLNSHRTNSEELDKLENKPLDLKLRPLVPFTFRVRNTNSYDSNDVFSVWFGTTGISYYDDLIVHNGVASSHVYLLGDDIDASIPTHALKDSTLQFQYMVTRNDSNSIDSVVFNPTQTNNFMLIEY